MITNVLYYGDNLDILRRYIPDESVDLVYLDPPFNSNGNYNVIFKDESGRKSDAQMAAPFPASRAWSTTDNTSEAVSDLGPFEGSAAGLLRHTAEARSPRRPSWGPSQLRAPSPS